MTTQAIHGELRRHGFVPAPKLATTGIWCLAPRRAPLLDPDKAKVEVVLLGADFSIGPPGRGATRYSFTTAPALAAILLQHGAHAPSDETLRYDFFALPLPAAKKAGR